MNAPQHQSLVRYDNPVLVSTTKHGKKKGGPVDNQQLTQTEDILNSILPPREWTAEGQLWVQYVSSTPATRLDVINLQVRHKLHYADRLLGEHSACPYPAQAGRRMRQLQQTVAVVAFERASVPSAESTVC